MHHLLRPLLFCLFLGIATPASATREPDLVALMRSADLVLRGTVSSVENTSRIQITVDETLRGRTPGTSVTFRYTYEGKGAIPFDKLKEDGDERVFCLHYVPDPDEKGTFHLRLVDPIFGIRRMTTDEEKQTRRALFLADRASAQHLCQEVLRLDWLQPFFHFDQADRTPLQITLTPMGLDRPLALTAAGQPVEFREMDEKDLPNDTLFVFTELSRTKNRAVLTFQIPMEGVTGEATFRRTEKGWTLDQTQGAEK